MGAHPALLSTCLRFPLHSLGANHGVTSHVELSDPARAATGFWALLFIPMWGGSALGEPKKQGFWVLEDTQCLWKCH